MGIKIEKWDHVSYSLFICSANPDSDYKTDWKTRLELRFWRYWVVIPLFFSIGPYRRWIDTSRHSWGGKGSGYWDCHGREFGLKYHGGLFSVAYGAATMDSSTTRNWSCFVPWHDHRQISKEFTSDVESYVIADFDLSVVTATIQTEKTRYRIGRGKWAWLGFIFPIRTYYSAEIKFSAETGSRKGSWKGGCTACYTPIDPKHNAEQAMYAYAEKNHMTVLPKVSS